MIAAPPNIIYTSKAAPVAERRRHTAIIATTFRGGDGRQHFFLNCEIPANTHGTIDDSICKRCGMGYSHVMLQHLELCQECVMEDAGQHAQAIQDSMGINLGWPRKGDYTQSEAAMLRNYHPRAMSKIDKREMTNEDQR